MSQQNGLNKFFRELGQLDQLPTASAYCQARQKLKPELFVHLNQVTADDYLQLSCEDGSFQLWRGHRVLGVDGTKLNLPDNELLRKAFSVVSNQHGTASECVQGLSVVLYDLLNDLGLAASLGPLRAEKEPLLTQLWSQTKANDLLVMDRGFLCYTVIAWAAKSGRHITIRCPRRSFTEIEQFWDSDDKERIVSLSVPRRAATRDFVREHKLGEQVTVRLLKFILPTGEQEVLLTTLCDREQYPHQEFYQLYGWRWKEETYFDRIKNIFEVERFSGNNERAIRQDFYGVIFLATLESVLCQSAQTTLTKRDEQRKPQTPARVNRAVSYVSLLDITVTLLADERISIEDALKQLHQLLQTAPTRHRPGRKAERRQRSLARSLRHQRHRKRLTA